MDYVSSTSVSISVEMEQEQEQEQEESGKDDSSSNSKPLLVGTCSPEEGIEELADLVEGAANNCRELLGLEGDGKWALVALVYLLQLGLRLEDALDGDEVGKHDGGDKERDDAEAEIHGFILRLKSLDPAHSGYYNEILGQPTTPL